MADELITDVGGNLATITLNRPSKRNALSRALLVALESGLTQAGHSSETRVLVLRANGPAFCAGMDLAEMEERAGRPDASEQWQEDTRVYREVLSRIFHLPFPTIAVVDGPALAGGMGLVLACDIVIGSSACRFSLPEPRRGITAAVVSPFLCHRLGVGPATYCLLSGSSLDAHDALRWGLVHRLVERDALETAVASQVDEVLQSSPSALRLTKQFLREQFAKSLNEALAPGAQVSAAARETDDAREGLAAFLEKRPPRWATE